MTTLKSRQKLKSRALAPDFRTVADVLAALGDIPPERVMFHLRPGKATERDLLKNDRMGCPPCELVDGFIVEKAMGQEESILGVRFGRYLDEYAESNDLGYVSGADGLVRLFPGLVRGPDLAFFRWRRPRARVIPNEAISSAVPELAVEILSKSNTREEMDRKLLEYFRAGVRLVWIVDAKHRTVRVHTSATTFIDLKDGDALDGADVLPGFRLPLAKLFARHAKAPKKRKKK